MKCADVYRFICDNLDESIHSARCRAIRQHINCCPSCKSYLDSVKKTVKLYRTAPAPHIPRAAHRSLMKTLSARLETATPPRKRSPRGTSR